MTTRKIILGLAGSLMVGALAMFAPTPVGSAVPADLPAGADPAHHSTDVNDPDPAHHRPYYVCSASTSTCVLTAIAGFDLNGNRLEDGEEPQNPDEVPGQFANYNPDPAHHSTDLNDPDPAHHQPTLEFNEDTGRWELTPIPGFDLFGFRVSESETNQPFFQ